MGVPSHSQQVQHAVNGLQMQMPVSGVLSHDKSLCTSM